MIKKFNTLSEALNSMSPTDQVTLGTADNLFHIIDHTDRDYDTPFAYSKGMAEKLGEATFAIYLVDLIFQVFI